MNSPWQFRRVHHREVHHCGDEAAWWQKAAIDPIVSARALWLRTHPLPPTRSMIGRDRTTSDTATDVNQGKAKVMVKPSNQTRIAKRSASPHQRPNSSTFSRQSRRHEVGRRWRVGNANRLWSRLPRLFRPSRRSARHLSRRGDKRTQNHDIAMAIKLARDL